jgi:phosphatidate phosphatase LPIN
MNVFEWAASVWSQGPQAGAIDVVVVRKKDGALSCSPFHVRFNKVAKRGDPRVVHMKVNSKDVGLSMKLGRAGEAFFVERARNRLVREGASGPPSPTRKSPTDYADVGPGSGTVVEEPEGNPMR